MQRTVGEEESSPKVVNPAGEFPFSSAITGDDDDAHNRHFVRQFRIYEDSYRMLSTRGLFLNGC